jgi:dihydroorotase
MVICIRGGHVVDPSAKYDQVADIFIENGIVVESVSGSIDKVVDVTGKTVIPGLIDAHCHLRDPGFEYKEDIQSGTASAAKGGFTTVACMPNTQPVCDNAAVVGYIKEKARSVGSCRVLPIGAVSKGQQGVELAEIGLMRENGIVAVSDDGRPVEKAEFMRKAMQYSADFGLTVISHCEDLSMASGGHMNEGYASLELGLRGIPSSAEEIMAARDIIISEYLDLPIHLAHLSTAGSVDLVRQAKARGVKVTCETCPHYFTLTEEACRGFNTMAKMNPPLRTEKDRLAVIAGIADGTIDMIATDHAPHHQDEKEIEFGLASNGIVGFETAFALSYTWLVKPGIISLADLISKMTTAPAKLFNQRLGSLMPGYPADLTIVDLNEKFTFDRDSMLSKARNTPYHNFELFGKTHLTLMEGRITYEA